MFCRDVSKKWIVTIGFWALPLIDHEEDYIKFIIHVEIQDVVHICIEISPTSWTTLMHTVFFKLENFIHGTALVFGISQRPLYSLDGPVCEKL